jgi:hypothetical protein
VANVLFLIKVHHFYVLLQVAFLSKGKLAIRILADIRPLACMGSQMIKELALVSHDDVALPVQVRMMVQAFKKAESLHLMAPFLEIVVGELSGGWNVLLLAVFRVHELFTI